MSQPLMDKMLDQDIQIERLQALVRKQSNQIARMQQYLKIAAEYKAKPNYGPNECDADPFATLVRTVEGMQAALLKGSKVEGREQKGRSRR